MRRKPENEGRTILVIEPDDSNRDLIETVLRQSGFGVISAVDPVEGLRMAREQRPDLILTELFERKAEGWRLLKTLKTDLATRDLPVIAFSAYALDGDQTAAARSGVDMYLSKPLPPSELVEAVERVLHG